jgi:signal transduction histidine kinase
MLRFRNYSIPAKLTWMNMLVSGTALGLACAAFIVYDLISFRQTIERNLSIQAQMVGSNSASALLFDDPQAAEKTLSALEAAPNIVTAGIYTPDGHPFAGYWRDHESQLNRLPTLSAARGQVHWLRDRRIVLVHVISFQSKTAGFVYIQSDLQDLFRRMQRYVLIVTAVFLASLLMALVTSSSIRQVIAARIVGLAETARVVSREKTYSVRASGTDDRDELAGLIDNFNEMLAQIQERDTELQSEIIERKQAEQTLHNQAEELSRQADELSRSQQEVLNLNAELERRVEERTAELQATNKELEAFTYSVSHDLRAPLRHISGFTKILVEDFGPSLPSEAQRQLQRIEQGAHRMGQLVDELLNLTRVGRQALSTQVTGLTSIVKEVQNTLAPETDGRRVEWKIGELPFVECDPTLVRQVFQNLIANALKYSRPRSPAVIEIGKMEKDGQNVIFIKDNGVGFSMKYADKLFGVFQRLHRPEDFEGTGVGLATVHRIVQKHGGRVWAEAELDKGATFYFTLGGGQHAPAKEAAIAAGAQI